MYGEYRKIRRMPIASESPTPSSMRSSAIDVLGDKLADRLGEADRSLTKTGQVPWRNRTQFVGLKLKKGA